MGSGRTLQTNRTSAAVTVGLLAAVVLTACSKPATTEPVPPGIELTATKMEVVGKGATEVSRSDQLAREILAPLDRYYEGTLFGVVFPTESFEPAFEEFTPTVANVARTEQASLMTLGETASRVKGVLEPDQVTSTVMAFSPEAGVVSHAGVAVSLKATGSSDDGTPIEIARQDFFILEKTSGGWRVVSYECRQRIDAPPGAGRDEAGGSHG